MTMLSLVISRGVAASRPSVSAVPIGSIYYSTDTHVLERNNGSSWDTMTAAALTDVTTTKGDLIVRGASALGRHGVGADGTVFVADSAQSDGVKWVARTVLRSTGSLSVANNTFPPAVYYPFGTDARKQGSITHDPSGVPTLVQLDATGLYRFTFEMTFPGATYTDTILFGYKNGAALGSPTTVVGQGIPTSPAGSQRVYIWEMLVEATAADTWKFGAFQASSGSQTVGIALTVTREDAP